MTTPMMTPFFLGLDEAADGCRGAVNLAREWRSCCLRALGYHDDGLDDDDASSPHDEPTRPRPTTRSDASYKLVNLIPDSSYRVLDNSSKKNTRLDPWMEAALQVNESICQTQYWISQKSFEYVRVSGMSSDDASLVESTVASFVATTATEIESLRQMVSGQAAAAATTRAQAQQVIEHRSGIVQILMLDLQQNVSIPFQALQRKRKRLAVHVWQNPLECTLWTTRHTRRAGDDEEVDDPTEDGDADHLLFLPKRPAHKLQTNLWESYHPPNLKKRPRRPQTAMLQRLDIKAGDRQGRGPQGGAEGGENTHSPMEPKDAPLSSSSWFSRHKRSKTVPAASGPAAAGTAEPSLRRRRNPPPSVSTPTEDVASSAWEGTRQHNFVVDASDDNDYYESHRDVLERESAQLQLVAHSDLDAVQQMERHMVNVTALLSQFATLVSDQATDVSNIHQATSDAKDNVDKGQENLIEAKERTEASRHYMASAIMGLSLLLLLFHWIRP